jgi:hypothetical protein
MLFTDIQKVQPQTLRNKLRDSALQTVGKAAQLLPSVADKYLAKPRVQFFFIHHILPDEVAAFRQILTALAQQHTFISYSEAVRRVQTGDIDKAYICFSSDDGYASNTVAAAVLAEFGISACFFLCPSIIGESDKQRINRFCTEQLRFGVTMPFMTWHDIAQLQAAGHEIGSHTNTHINVAHESPAKIAEEFGMAKYILDLQCGTVQHLALPFGRFAKVEKDWWQAAQQAGYTSCASATNGCHTTQTNNVDFLHRNLVLPAWGVEQHLAYLVWNAVVGTVALVRPPQ